MVLRKIIKKSLLLFVPNITPPKNLQKNVCLRLSRLRGMKKLTVYV